MKRIIGVALSVALATGAAACSDKSPPSAPDETILSAPPGTLVSNALATPSSVSSMGARSSLARSASRVAYVSAVPGTFPQAVSMSIRNQTTGGPSTSVEVLDGGFDPVGIDAEADNELSLTALAAGGGLTVMAVRVPPRRPPGVVRTRPGKGRTDVALNVQVLVVFSEPVQPSSVTSSSFSLRRDGNVVSGRVQVSVDGLSAEFIPDSPLQPETTYELTVDRSIRDLDGDALDEITVVPFTTVTTVYRLELVNDEPLPVKSPYGAGEWDYDSDAGTWQLFEASFTLHVDGTYTDSGRHRARSGATSSYSFSGTYTRTSPSTLQLRAAGSTLITSATISADRLIWDWGNGTVLTYER